MNEYRDWRVIRTVNLKSPASEVWQDVGGFFNIHTWHPDIEKTENVPDQMTSQHIRRVLTFPGQPVTVEELVSMNNENYEYHYKWHAGQWGEEVKKYRACIRLLELDMAETCVFQWSSTFWYFEDALTQFYENGCRALAEKYGS